MGEGADRVTIPGAATEVNPGRVISGLHRDQPDGTSITTAKPDWAPPWQRTPLV